MKRLCIVVSVLVGAVALVGVGPAPAVAGTGSGPGGTVVAWGNPRPGDDFGQASVPSELDGVAVDAIAAGRLFNLVLKSDGTVFGWGFNTSGQTTPPAGLTHVVAIAAGVAHSLALKSDGTVIGWGANNWGQATPPAGLSNVVAIAAGLDHSLALKSDGTVTGWGHNHLGQATVPAGLTDVVAIAAGYYYSLALSSDGTVTAWGDDGRATVPAGLTDVVAIAASEYHSLALKSDGTVTAWGSNAYGQTSVPRGLTNVVAIAAGEYHSLAISEQYGGVVAWGTYSNGLSVVVPTELQRGVVVTAVAGGRDHSLALVAPRPAGLLPSVDYPTGGGSGLSVALGDLDRDGDLDVVAPNAYVDSVSVLLGNGDGTLQAKVDYGTGTDTWPVFVAVGDLDGDGDLDLAVASWMSDSVAVLLGNGDGTFQTSVGYATGVSPRGVAVGDLNGDGHMDLVTANEDSDSVSVLLGNGDGTFQGKIDYSAGSDSYPYSVAVGELNGDRHLDLAVADQSGRVSVLLGNGDGTFHDEIDYAAGALPRSVAVGDLDSDGHADLAVANFDARSVSVLLGNGDGTFEGKVDYGTGLRPASVAIGDLDGGGSPDLALATQSYYGSVSVLLGNGDGTFQDKIDYLTEEPTSAAIGDLNGDGSPDVAVAKSFSAGVMLNDRAGQTIVFTSTPPTDAVYGGTPYTVTATGGDSGNPVVFSVDAASTSVCSISGSDISFIGVGTCTIDANQAGDDNYLAAAQAQQSFAVGKAGQTIVFTSTPPTDAVYGGTPYTVTATGGQSGNPVVFSIAIASRAVCSLSGASVSFIGAGICTIYANQAGNETYAAAVQAQQSFTVAKAASPTIIINNIPTAAVYGAKFTPMFTYAGDGSTSVRSATTSICKVSSSVVTFVGVGLCTLLARASATRLYNAATGPEQSFWVEKASTTISISNVPKSPKVGASFKPTYTYKGDGITSTTATGSCSVVGNTVTFTAPGTCELRAHATAGVNYQATDGQLQPVTVK